MNVAQGKKENLLFVRLFFALKEKRNNMGLYQGNKIGALHYL